MKDIKIVYGKTGAHTNEDMKTIEQMIKDKVNDGYKIISSNMVVSGASGMLPANLWIYAIMEKEC